MTVERSVNDSAFEAAMAGPDDTWEEVAEQQAREISRLREREADIAGMLQVADGGQYRADWEAPIRRLVEWRKALQSLTPGGSEFQSPETCEAYVRERLRQGHEKAKEVVRLGRETARLREELSRAAVREHILIERAETYLLVNDPGDPVVQAARRSLEAAIKHPSPLSDAIKEVLEAALRETAEDEELEIPDPKSIERSRLARRAAVDRYLALLEGRDRKGG